MTEKNKIKVNISGNDYILLSEDSEEHVQKVAAYVDKKFKQLSETSLNLSISLVSVLGAINIADELLKSNDDLQKMREQLIMYVDEIAKLKTENANLKSKMENQQGGNKR